MIGAFMSVVISSNATTDPLAGWTKYREITVTGSSSGEQTDYQVKITVPYDADMRADFSDIRFVSANKTSFLDYWIESKTNSSTADFWVQIPVVPVSPNTVTVYMYYGNSEASTLSNGVNTFISGTDFAQDDGFLFRDGGVDEIYGNSAGTVRSNGGLLSLVAIDRASDSLVANGNYRFNMPINGYITDNTNLDDAEDVIVDGNYAYVPCRGGARLSVFNISVASLPTFVSSFTDIELTEAMGVAKNESVIYLTSWHNHKLLILDATDPANITKISSIEIGTTEGGGDPDELRKVFYLDGYAYVTHSHDQKLYVVDVSDPSSPSITGSVATGDGAFAVFVKGNYAYVGGCFIGASLKVIDISNKSAPTVVKTLASSDYTCCGGFANSGDNLYAVYYSSNSFVAFDISDPPNTVQKGILKTALLANPNRLDIFGDTAYVASAGMDALVLVDISNPANPTYLGMNNNIIMDRAYGVKHYAGKIFVIARGSDSLIAFDSPTISVLNWSVADNFSVRTKFKLSSATSGAWIPLTGISVNGSAITSSADAYSLNPIWYNNTLQLVEFFGASGTWYKQASSTIALSVNTTYIMELKKVGGNATLSVYQTNGALVGSSAISALTNSGVSYRKLMPFHGTQLSMNWPAGKTSSQEIYFSFLRKYVASEPTYSIGSEVSI